MTIRTLHARINLGEVKIKGSEFKDGPHNVKIIGISSYPKEQLTFTVQGKEGWIYTYVPAHYLTFGNIWVKQEKTFLCKGLEFVITPPLVNKFNIFEGSAEALFAIDWLSENELLHCGRLIDGGGIVIYPHREFIVKNCPRLEKMRTTWR